MAQAPKYKVYDNDGCYVASCKEISDATILVSIGYPDRGSIRLGHGKVLFVHGIDDAFSYDEIAERAARQEERIHASALKKAQREGGAA